jgi:hypothetical protein
MRYVREQRKRKGKMTMKRIQLATFILFGIFVLLGIGTTAIAQDADSARADEPEATAESAEGLVPLELELPKPMFVGTPKDIRAPNLERPRKGARKPLLVPENVENLAFEKEVTVSDDEPVIGEPELITDGDKEAGDGSYVEFGPGKQWVQIDLGQESKVYAVVVWHYHQQARVYHDVVIQLADDPDMTENVTTIFNADHDNSSGLGVGKDKAYIETAEGKLIDAGGAEGRYIRLYSKGNTSNPMNHYIEVEAYGTPVE